MTVAVASGRLDRVITIQQRAQSKDVDGGIVDTWSDFAANIWAERNNSDGGEKQATRHGGVSADVGVQFTIRYISGVTEQMRVVSDGKNYNIRHINDIKHAGAVLILKCDNGGNNGR